MVEDSTIRGRYFDGPGGTGRAVRVRPTVEGLVLEPVEPTGGTVQRFSWTGLQFERGGYQGRQIVVQLGDPAERRALFLEPEGLVEALEAGGAPRDVVERVRALRSRQRRRVWRRFAIGFALVLVLGSAPWWGCRLVEHAVLASVTPEQEAAIGKRLLQGVRSRFHDKGVVYVFVRNTAEELRTAGGDLTRGFPIEIHLLVEDNPNAFAAPGGVIVVHTGLVAAAHDPQEVAGVIAHEIGHVVRRHALRSLVRKAGWWAAVAIVFDPTSAVGYLTGSLGSLAFSRSFEREADAIAVELMWRAGYDPLAVGRFVERLSRERGANVPAILSTHPGGEERLERVRRLAERLGPHEHRPPPLPASWEEIQAEAKALSRPPVGAH